MLKLFKHQQDLVDLAPKKWLIAHSVGTGKTLTSLKLIEKHQCKSCLVICPKSLVNQWQEQVDDKFLVLSKEQLRKSLKTCLNTKQYAWTNAIFSVITRAN